MRINDESLIENVENCTSAGRHDICNVSFLKRGRHTLVKYNSQLSL